MKPAIFPDQPGGCGRKFQDGDDVLQNSTASNRICPEIRRCSVRFGSLGLQRHEHLGADLAAGDIVGSFQIPAIGRVIGLEHNAVAVQLADGVAVFFFRTNVSLTKNPE